MSKLYVQGATFVGHPRGTTEDAVLIEHDRIVAVGGVHELPCPPDAERLDGRGCLLAPGFIDLQLNGAFGLDFTAAPETIWEVGARLPCYGVTAFLPTIVTSPLATIAAAQRVLEAGPPAGYRGAAPLGLHLEGPFLNPAKRGAHDPALMRLPALADVANWSPDQGVRLVTLAPELPGSLEVIQALCERGILVSAGHSMASYDEARAALQAGIGYGTHVFNAMPPLDHREPGLPGALLSDRNALIGIIPDGIHLHPAVVALIWRLKGPRQVSLVTDAMAALGKSPGRYVLGALDVLVDATSARLSDGRLAGSILSLDQAVRNLVTYTGCTPGEAVATVTAVPAQALRLAGRGQIRPGQMADLTLFTPDLHVAATIIAGQVVWQSPPTNTPH